MKTLRAWALALCAVLAAAQPAAAQALEHFLQISGVEGESADPRHRGWIDLAGWSWGLRQDEAGAQFDPFAWRQGVDSSVVPLFLGVAAGTRFEQAVLDVSDPAEGGGVFFQMVFAGAQPVSLVIADGSDVSAALRYGAVTLRYDDGHGWIEGRFETGPQGVGFAGDARVLEGLFRAGGAVALDIGALPPVPEPGPLALWATALPLLALARRRARVPAQARR